MSSTSCTRTTGSWPARRSELAERIGRPWLVTVHATEYGRHQGWVQKHPQSHIHAAERRMVRRADAVITCSEYMRGHVSRVFRTPADRITAIPNGLDPRDLEPQVEDLDALRRRFAAPDQRLVLLVGRLVYEKGFHLALDALAPVIEELGDVRFVVAGTGSAEAELKAQARRLGLGRHGAFLGWVGDDMLHALYRISDLCIVPSIYEPFGLVALEAMASGCLCIVADTGGLREVVPADGSVGLRFPLARPDALGRRARGDPDRRRDARASSSTTRGSTCCGSTGPRSRDGRRRSTPRSSRPRPAASSRPAEPVPGQRSVPRRPRRIAARSSSASAARSAAPRAAEERSPRSFRNSSRASEKIFVNESSVRM